MPGKDQDVTLQNYPLDRRFLKDLLSPECDIIIHSGGCIQRWNGNANPVMNFTFIESSSAVAIISCKSFTRSIDVEYSGQIRRHVRDVLIFAECCSPGSVERLKESAKSAGYKGFWYLYTCNPKTSICAFNEREWENFLSVIKKIAYKKTGKFK